MVQLDQSYGSVVAGEFCNYGACYDDEPNSNNNNNSFRRNYPLPGGPQNCPGGLGSMLPPAPLVQSSWSQVAESTMPLKASKMTHAYGGNTADTPYSFQASVEFRSKEISNKLIVINLVSLIINLSLAIVAFYFAFVNDSSSTSAFAADCVLDFISSGIVLWRYYGDLNSVYMHAREQIACVYLGALFEISAIAIIVKASSDMAAGVGEEPEVVGYDLIYLAAAATLACIVLTAFKCTLYKTIRDNSILLDVINTVVSTVFAMSIIMSQALINIDPSFWYLDPILSIVLALFMAAFGIKVIHQNFDILRPSFNCASSPTGQQKVDQKLLFNQHDRSLKQMDKFEIGHNNNYESNLNSSIDLNRTKTWQKTDYSTISFI